MIPPNAKKVFSGIIYDVYQREQEMFDGSTAIFEMVKRTGTVLVIPILDNGNILVAEEDQPTKGEFIDFIGGRQEKDEALERTAERELLEETGYKAKSFELFHAKNIGGPKFDWQINYYFAKGLTKVQNQKLDPGEKIKVLEISLHDFLHLRFPKDIPLDKDFVKMIGYIKETSEILEKMKN